jgi:hypothetical protein
MSKIKKKASARKASLRDFYLSYTDGLLSLQPQERDRQISLAGGHLLWALKRRKGAVYLFDSPKAVYDTCRKVSKEGLRAAPSNQSMRALQKKIKDLVDGEERLGSMTTRPKGSVDEPALLAKLDQMAMLQRYFQVRKTSDDPIDFAGMCRPSHLLRVMYARLSGFKSGKVHLESPLEGLLHLSLHSPCFLFYDDDLYVSRPPIELHLDHSGRVNATDRPAIRFADDWTASVIGGVRVNERFFSPNYKIKSDDILHEENMEVRRVMMERLGIDNFLLDIEANEIARDDYGVLYRGKEFPVFKHWLGNTEQLTYVRLLNSTPEPGTTDDFKEYLLRVPPETKTPQEAVGWSFELETEQYEPAQQT